jgi:Fic family protein
MSVAGYKWRQIADIPEGLRHHRDRELEALFEVWEEQRQMSGDGRSIRRFQEEFAREWAIETGIIEGVYTLDRGIAQTLIERGIDASYIPHNATNRDPELVARTVQAHAEVLEGLFAFVKGERSLIVGYIKELHAALLQYQSAVVVFDQFGNPHEVELQKGAYKTLPNNPRRPDGAIHEYCPPEHVASEMDRLVEMYQRHNATDISRHAEAAWLHHAFTQIHPFQDGNGRVARSIATLVLLKARYFPLVVTRDDRENYISALEAADRGDLSALVHEVSRLQKRSLTKGITHLTEARPVGSLEEALDVTRDVLVKVGRIIPAEYHAAKEHAGHLQNLTQQRFGIVLSRLRLDIARANEGFEFASGMRAQEISLKSLSLRFKYDLNNLIYDQSVYMQLTAHGVVSTATIAFHGVGPSFRGVLAAVAYFQTQGGEFVALSEDPFRFTYKDEREDLGRRYLEWLDKALIEALAIWRRTIA